LASLQKLLDLEHALIQDAYEFEYVRRQQELERQRGERRFRQLVENASCLIVILRPEEELLYFNRCAEDVTGFRADDLRRQHGSVLRLLGQDTNVVSRRLRAVLEQSVPQSYEERMQGRTGPPRWVTWTLTRIDEFEEGPAVLAVGHDVTEARLASEQLLQANRLATIGEMYTGLAHESRNALQRLRVCTDRLMDQVSDRPDAVEVLQRAQRAQDDLRQLLDEVRSFAAPIVLERTRCRLPALWREGWSLLQTMHRSRRATLADSGIDAGLEIVVDRFWIVQAFRNVLENALAACGDPAIIRIGCRLFQVEGSECVEITIEDNGPGFAMETVDRAFEPFFTTKSTGTGLGLAIVRRVIEAHGGVVAAGNGPDGGARIYLTLPCRAEP
ncbi:MAG TPA: ATP-binding protein, partial [Lacipirellulaceae bacterium]|nr:ATP-binding protein [Lacipirellulaceae bacterium]